MSKPKENKVCVYAITKNEEQFVERWYRSMKFADFVVVMDTGSTDNTLELLKQQSNGNLRYYNTKKYWTDGHLFIYSKEIKPWSFGKARQACLELCPRSANIYVSTDFDEYFDNDNWVDVLKKKWQPNHERGVYKYSWSHHEDGSSARIFHYNKIHNRNWFWKYPVHELLCSTERGTEGYSQENACYLFNEIHLHHFPDKNKPRTQYLPLLEQRAKEDPNDYYGLIYLAHEYTYRKMYEKSIETLNEILRRFDDRMSSIEKASCYLFIGDGYRVMYNETNDEDLKKKYLSLSTSSYFISISIEKTYREPYIGLGKFYLDSKEYDKSIFYVKEGLKNGVRHFTWLERDDSWTYGPYDILSLAYYYGGHKMESLSYAVKAASYDKMNERLQNNVNQILKTTSDIDFI